MLKNINQLKILKAIVISFIFIYITNIVYNVNEFALSINFFMSLGIYSILSYVALIGYKLNKNLYHNIDLEYVLKEYKIIVFRAINASFKPIFFPSSYDLPL